MDPNDFLQLMGVGDRPGVWVCPFTPFRHRTYEGQYLPPAIRPVSGIMSPAEEQWTGSIASPPFKSMFKTRIQTYWSDADSAGIVYFSHFFRFVESAEEEMFRAAGVERAILLDRHKIWFPRVEAFARFLSPIKYGDRILVKLIPHRKGQKTVRYDFELVHAENGTKFSEGYMTVVCVDRKSFKSVPIPHEIAEILKRH